MRSARLINHEQLYVSISRPRLDAHVYTNYAQALSRAVTRNPKKEIALDAVKQRAQWLKAPPLTTDLHPASSPTRSLEIST